MVDTSECKLYELYRVYYRNSGWTAGSGSAFDLKSNALRPDTWTSADAAGLPVLPGLVRYDEVDLDLSSLPHGCYLILANGLSALCCR